MWLDLEHLAFGPLRSARVVPPSLEQPSTRARVELEIRPPGPSMFVVYQRVPYRRHQRVDRGLELERSGLRHPILTPVVHGAHYSARLRISDVVVDLRSGL
jgi:hypothetical protein